MSAIDPVNISDEQERWNKTAEGVLRRILWEIEQEVIHPKELAVIWMDYTGGEKRTLCQAATDHDSIKLHGMISAANVLMLEGN